MSIHKEVPFATWDDLLTYLKHTEWVTYHAPMDHLATNVRAKAFKNGKVRVFAYYPFTADEGHLSRFGAVAWKCPTCGDRNDIGEPCRCGATEKREEPASHDCDTCRIPDCC